PRRLLQLGTWTSTLNYQLNRITQATHLELHRTGGNGCRRLSSGRLTRSCLSDYFQKGVAGKC
ncbi:MAG: hypothetical protein RLZZ274_1733, partial [Cyanobacteriota bacterium]